MSSLVNGQNYRMSGKVLQLTAPSGGVTVGTAYLIGGILVVALQTVAQTLPFEGMTVGVFDLPKVGSQAWTEGEKIYWDDGNHRCTSVATAGQLVGVAVAPLPGSGSGETTGRIRLNGTAPGQATGPQATIAALTFGTNIGNASINNVLTDSSATNPSDAQFNELAHEVGAKINEILTALKAAGIIASS